MPRETNRNGPIRRTASCVAVIVAVCFSTNLWSDDTPQSAPAASLPVPTGPAQVEAEKKIRDAFPNVDKLPQNQRSPTAVKMLDAAAGMQDDPSAMYVLLKKCGALAASAGDGEISLKAASILGKSFDMDSDELALEWLRKASSLQLHPDIAKALVDSILTFANSATAKLKFDVMARSLAAAEMAARNGTQQFRAD